MSGTALTTVSPSRVRMRRSVVCVAGCCGPKLSVQRYSLSVPSRAPASIISTGMTILVTDESALRPRDHRQVVAFAAAAQRVVLPQGEGGELLRHQDAAQVRVAVELDAEHVVDLALHPVGAFPQ